MTRIQLIECALQLFKLLSSLAELASRSRALVVGKVFGRFRDERIEVRCGLRRPGGCRCTSVPLENLKTSEGKGIILSLILFATQPELPCALGPNAAPDRSLVASRSHLSSSSPVPHGRYYLR